MINEQQPNIPPVPETNPRQMERKFKSLVSTLQETVLYLKRLRDENAPNYQTERMKALESVRDLIKNSQSKFTESQITELRNLRKLMMTQSYEDLPVDQEAEKAYQEAQERLKKELAAEDAEYKSEEKILETKGIIMKNRLAEKGDPEDQVAANKEAIVLLEDFMKANNMQDMKFLLEKGKNESLNYLDKLKQAIQAELSKPSNILPPEKLIAMQSFLDKFEAEQEYEKLMSRLKKEPGAQKTA